MGKEPQVGMCKGCRDKETCEFSSADKEQCEVDTVVNVIGIPGGQKQSGPVGVRVYQVRDEKYRCLLEKGHEGPHTWWRAPCRAILLAPNPYNTPEYREAMWDMI